ncbi:GNAT family N-acetyltransferase [Microbacterium sp. zg.Y625]|uniref:GNAT family N-acetyltransferase n=1 Tax=Microbacterium jiangjiandongii TaxID=3049071 RepID=UPI00214BA9DD|nr:MULTISPECIES: GNAT family N-acetyltransferase [unclassified Microbacterium]MCR2792660.1 GNAT family N-acetyltransferase [Microbacterium sp. zg.Y625]MCR2814652.1 GNAT family N-acetyltransferase [Microbacterium sp. zg.Y843]WIM26643.1 GNAT family N-acetyltransferase [Microbacterium sp. zg-Y625]
MTPASDPRLSVRRIRADEWREVRALRLAATADPDAAIAFLESHATTAARSDAFWQSRTEDAALGETAAQFIAILDDEPVGSAVVLVRATGQTDHLGRFVDDRRADVVGVWVRPDSRGSGAIDLLLDAAAQWAQSAGLSRVHLDVHRDNTRAQAAYRRAGFLPTGETLDGPIGPEIVMARDLPGTGDHR